MSLWEKQSCKVYTCLVNLRITLKKKKTLDVVGRFLYVYILETELSQLINYVFHPV